MTANLLKMERETGIEPATSSLGNSISIENKKLMRRRRRILSTQVYENIHRTFPRFRNRSNRSNNKLPQDCLESPHGMPAEMAGRQRRPGGIPPYANLRRFAATTSPTYGSRMPCSSQKYCTKLGAFFCRLCRRRS